MSKYRIIETFNGAFQVEVLRPFMDGEDNHLDWELDAQFDQYEPAYQYIKNLQNSFHGKVVYET